MSVLHDELFERACQVIPGGVNSPVRSFRSVGGTPVFAARGQGAWLTTADGRTLCDFCLSWGPLILGHAHPQVVAAITQAAQEGSSFGLATEREVVFAETLRQHAPELEQVRLVSSGTEAVMSALRLARGYTGRERIVMCAGGYHGHHDALLVSAGSGLLSQGEPSSAGVPHALAAQTTVLPYNDLTALEACFATQGAQIAAVIIEPVAGNMGVVVPQPEYLAALRRLTSAHGALLIFDEVITGFRLRLGTWAGALGIRPDLTTLGKIIGGGLPLAAFGGRAEVMAQLAPCGPVYQAGTLSGNPLAVAAGQATLAVLADENPYPDLEQRTSDLVTGLREVAQRQGQALVVNQIGSLFTPFFTTGPVTDLEGAKGSDTAAYGRFFHAMLENGCYLPPAQFEAAFVSTAHGDAEVAAYLAATASAFRS